MIKIKSLNSFSFIAIFLSLFAANIFNISLVEAQEENSEEVNGFGDSLLRFTCADGQRPPVGLFPNEVINFNAIENEDGTSGEFIIFGVDTGGTKEGEINTIDISGDQFTLSGIETSDNLCQDEVPSDITISGDCEINDRLPVAEMRFEAENGEQGTFSGGVECIDNDIPIKNNLMNQDNV